jgi:hypothetical protein
MWDPQRLTTLWASMAWYRHIFILPFTGGSRTTVQETLSPCKFGTCWTLYVFAWFFIFTLWLLETENTYINYGTLKLNVGVMLIVKTMYCIGNVGECYRSSYGDETVTPDMTVAFLSMVGELRIVIFLITKFPNFYEIGMFIFLSTEFHN